MKQFDDNRNPKVSVTVVTYNHGPWLADCLESIVTQETDFPFEVIVGDDASSDGLTPQILRMYGEKYPGIVIPIFREHNIGPSANYFDVIQRARGEFIAHIDGDDLAKPKKLQRLHDILENLPAVGLVGHQCDVIDKDGCLLGEFSSIEVDREFDLNYLFANHAIFPHSSIMYRASEKKSLKYEGRNVIDLNIYMRACGGKGIFYVSDSLGFYRRAVGVASRDYTNNLQDNVLREAREIGVKFCSRRSYMANLTIHRACDAYRKGNYGAFIFNIINSFFLHPYKSSVFLVGALGKLITRGF